MAETLYRKALRITESAVGEEDLRTARLLTLLAKVRLDQRDYDEAEELCARAVRIEEKMSPTDSVFRVLTLSTYAKVMHHKGQKRRAEELDKTAKRIADSVKTGVRAHTIDVTDLR
jgi:ATP/maltotriose-dependent transcriptional regulator MalT